MKGKPIGLLIFMFSSFFLYSCYPMYKWEGNKSYYIDKLGVKRYVKLYHKGVQITHGGKIIIDSVYEIR